MAKKAWYSYSWAKDYGGKEPFGSFPKPDLNVQCPDGTAITAIGSGTVSAVVANGSDAYGAHVTVRLDAPINSIATHEAYLHLQANPPVRQGQRVGIGTVIGYSGGAAAAGAQKVPVGFALYNGDEYGHGASWSEYVGSPALNPTAVLAAAAAGGSIISSGGGAAGGITSGVNPVAALFGTVGATDQVTTGGITGVAQKAAITVAPNADVTILLGILDQVLAITNPFTIEAPTVSVAGATFTDPIAWLSGLGTNLANNFAAFTVRLVFFILALFVFYKVFSVFIDFGAIGQAVSSGIKAAGALAI